MQKLKVKLTGTAPMLMHNGAMANPLDAKVAYMKQFTKKRGKTEKDLKDLARMEWEAGLYLEQGEVVVPSTNIHKCFIDGARVTKNGKGVEAGVRIAATGAVLTYDGLKIKKTSKDDVFPSPELDEAFDQQFKTKGCMQMVTVGQAKTPRCRPIFSNWSCEVNLLYNEDIINKETVISAIKDSGVMKGLGDRRPIYGAFEVEIVE